MTACEFHPEVQAVAFAPQSTDEGETVTWIPVCCAHDEDDWWDGADWGPIPFERFKEAR